MIPEKAKKPPVRPIKAPRRQPERGRGRHTPSKTYAPQGITATQSPRGPACRLLQSIGGGLHGAEPTSGPALLPGVCVRPSSHRGGPPGPGISEKAILDRKKNTARMSNRVKNRLRYSEFCGTIRNRGKQWQDAGRYQHPAPLCGRRDLPHNSIAAPAFIISEMPPFYKRRFWRFVS